MDISLAGKVALITGGSRGIGLAIAKSYADSGAQVMLTSRKEVSLRDAAKFVVEAPHTLLVTQATPNSLRSA